MTMKDVIVGESYLTNQFKLIRILECYKTNVGSYRNPREMTHWRALNLDTKREITIKSASKLMRKAIPADFKYAKS